MYVVDPSNYQVQKFDSSGNLKLTWGKQGAGNGEFGAATIRTLTIDGWFDVTYQGPYGVAVDSVGNVYLTDPGNRRVQKFDSAGNFKFAWPDPATGGLKFPLGIAVDSADNVYVVDAQACQVLLFYEIETTQPTFQPVGPRNMCIYVLGSDGNLWFETSPFGKIPPPRLQVDGNVAAFQALDGNNVVVLGADGNLWYEVWPFGNVQETINNRKQIDANVGAFQAVLSGYGNNIFVSGTDGNLWCETWPPVNVQETITTRKQIDAKVRAFQALDVNDAFVLGTDGNLWFEGLPFGSVAQTIKNRRQVDAAVKAFQTVVGDAYNIYVLGTDGKLWLETWPAPDPSAPGTHPIWGNVQETVNNRKLVDTNVAAFQAIDVNTVFVLGRDGNLWLETSPFGNVQETINTRERVDSSVGAFNVWVDAHNVLGGWVVFVKDTDHILWRDDSPIPFPPSKTWTRMQIDGSVM